MKMAKLQVTAKGTVLAQQVNENIEVTDALFALTNSRKAA